jgi:uncharacterized protein (UPF0335 family)
MAKVKNEIAEAGHNSTAVDAGHLRAFIERVERLEEDKRALADDIREVYLEAKGNGYDIKIMRRVVALRRMDRDKRKEEEAILDLYLSALGELADTPLGRSAVSRQFGAVQ